MADPSSPVQTPEVRRGEVFLIPLLPGVFGVCRAVQLSGRFNGICYIAAEWFGPTAPELTVRALLWPLGLRPFSWRNDPCAGWIREPPPRDLRSLGILPPTQDDFTLSERVKPVTWTWMREQMAGQFARLQETQQALDLRPPPLPPEPGKETEHRYQPMLRHTLEDVRRDGFFAEWRPSITPEVVQASRQIILDAIDTLLKLGPGAPPPLKLDVLVDIIERFNRLESDTSFILAQERNDICDLIEELASLVDLDDYQDELDDLRTW